jgi:hypothetical protein
MSVIENAALPDNSAFLLSMEEARMNTTSPQSSALSMDSSLCLSPIPASPSTLRGSHSSALFHGDDENDDGDGDDESLGMHSLDGYDDDHHKQWYEPIHSPTGPSLPSYYDPAVDVNKTNSVPNEFDFGMSWMCVYDLDSVCVNVDLDESVQGVPLPMQLQLQPRCSTIHTRGVQLEQGGEPAVPIPAVPLSPSSAATPASVPTSAAPAIPTGFLPEHLREVFSTGLLPVMMDWFQSSDLAALSSSCSTKTMSSKPVWNGHLPLAPASTLSSSSKPAEKKEHGRRRARSEIGKSMLRPRQHLSPPGPSPLQHVIWCASPNNSYDEEDCVDENVELVYDDSPLVCAFFYFFSFVTFS